MDKTVEDWFNTNKKLKNISDIKKLEKYIVNQINDNILSDSLINSLKFSSDYEFTYYDLDKIDCDKIKVRPENIFKLNFLIIIKILEKYFKNIKFKISFEAAGENDKSIKKPSATFKHDIYIIIFDDDDNYYDFGLEYFETIHDRIKDDDKELSSLVNLDSYFYYEEKSKNYNIFMQETIHSIITSICSLIDEPYILSKINYFNNYKNSKTLKIDTELFNQIINWKKNDLVDFEKFFNDLQPKNQLTDKFFSINEFLEFINNEYNIDINFVNDNFLCDYKYFINVIVLVDNNCSDKIQHYLKIYTRTMDILINSQKQIISFIKKTNNNKKFIPRYLQNFLRLHIQNYKCVQTQQKTLKILQNKFKN